MAWIKSDQTLEKHPKILRLKKALNCDIDNVIGFLHRFWWWALTYAEDGDLSSYSKEDIAEIMNVNVDTINYLYNTGWIDVNNLIHDWLDYSGQYLKAKYRTSNPEKLENIIKKYSQVDSQTEISLKTDKIRLDKIRFKESYSMIYSKEFNMFWSIYPNKVDKQTAFEKWRMQLKRGKKHEDLIKAAENYRNHCDRKGIQKEYIMHGRTFLGIHNRYIDYLNINEPEHEKRLSREEILQQRRDELKNKDGGLINE